MSEGNVVKLIKSMKIMSMGMQKSKQTRLKKKKNNHPIRFPSQEDILAEEELIVKDDE
ncbi:MAG: hypothetical protein N2662_11255 [Bacteroidales bacterium]|nr:hypothetical protein [Bacteroidales bacterium]